MAAAPQPEPHARRFAPTDHLSSEAVAAFADDRLAAGARDRALRHLGKCPECLEAVHIQRAARYALRQSGPVRMPGDLADRLAHLTGGEVGGVAWPGAARPDTARPSTGWQRLLRWLSQ